MTGSELTVLASRYLLATAAGDSPARSEVLSVMSCAELAGGLSRICRAMAQELGDVTDRSMTSVLDGVLEQAVARHRENVVLA